jgi:uncharacterized protein YfcZ (UPF0381/DUF406 family)
VGLQQRLFSKRLATLAAGLALAGGRLLAQATVGEASPTGALVSRTTVSEHPPDWLVAALVSKEAEVESTVVKPCKTKKEKLIAAERQRIEGCDHCRDQLPQLAIVERQALARCDIAGIDERIADVDEHKDAVIARLKTLVSQFQRQAQSNEVLSEEIKDGEIEAEATFTEAAVGQTMDKLVNWAPDKQIELIKAAEGRLNEVKAPSRVINGELGAFVTEMKGELAGKSKAEARAIIVARLEKVNLLVGGVRSLNLAQGQVASHNLDKVMGAKPDVTGEVLDAAYASLVTGLQIAEDESAKSVATIVRLNHVLGYAQDTVKISAVFANLYQLQQNVEGLSSLAKAAESQRRTAKSELDYLVKVRRGLVEERDNAQHVASP